MCGRYLFSADDEREEAMEMLRQLKALGKEAEFRGGEIFPTNLAPVLTTRQLAPSLITWGFPHFSGKGVIVNARSESVREKKMFGGCFAERRCVVPATGYFEWKDTGGSKKTKYLFTLQNSSLVYMAGIWGEFEGEQRFVILTTEANESARKVHHRMPVLLPKARIAEWISSESSALELMCRPMPVVCGEAM